MKYLHAMIRVHDLEATSRFFTEGLGLRQTRRMDHEAGRFTLVYFGAPENPEAEIELTYNWGTETYDMGTAYGHIAVAVADAKAACEKIRAAGGNVTREAGPVKGGTTVIAFVTDPDGYKIELIQRAAAAAGGGLR